MGKRGNIQRAYCTRQFGLRCILLLVVLIFSNIIEEVAGEKMKVDYLHFTSQGQRLQMAYTYQKSTKPETATVLLLHGKNFNLSYWTSTIDFLISNGYHVIAPDQVGFGRSSKPETYQYSFQQLAYNTKLLLDSLNIEKVIVLGHSMGGMLATRFTLMYPERCMQMILENPIGLEDWKQKVPYFTVDDEYRKELYKTKEELKKHMLENYFHNDWKKEYDPLLEESAAYLKANDFTASAKCMAFTSDMIFTQPVCEEFSLLKIPTTLIIGQADRTAIGKERANPEVAAALGNYPVLGKATAAKINNCCLIELEGIGHIPHVENFKLFSENLLKILVIKDLK